MRPLLTLILICFITIVFGQNYISNPGFESHANINCIGCEIDNINELIPGWRSLGFFPQPYSADYEYSSDEIRKGYNAEIYTPHEGKGLCAIPFYGSSGTSRIGGKSGYLISELEKALEKGAIYELSFWVKVKENFSGELDDFEYLKNFGAAFYHHFPKLTIPEKNLIVDNTPFLIDSLVVGKWHKVNYFFSPKVELNFITFGWFQNSICPVSLPKQNEISRFEYLIDGISLEKVPESEGESEKIYDYPDLNVPKPKTGTDFGETSVKILFEFSSDTLTSKAQHILDSTILLFENKVYVLSGHTDSIGHDNQALSYRRAEAVLNYILEHSEIPAYHFIISAEGSSNPDASNSSEEGRVMNRRVEIRESPLSVHQHLYKLASKAANIGNLDSAFTFLRLWQQHPNADQILLLYDTDLESLHDDPRWKGVKYYVQASFSKYVKSELAFKLAHIYCKDQRYRDLSSDFKSAKGYIPSEYDIDYLIAGKILESESEAEVISRIAADMDQILERHGWPDPAEVGLRQSIAPVYAILHSEDIALHKKYLPLVKTAFQEGKLNGKWYATIVDRILKAEHGLQRYGTTYFPNPNDSLQFSVGALEYPEQVDSLRAEVNMPPLRLREFEVILEKD